MFDSYPYGSISHYMEKRNHLDEVELREIASCLLLGLSYTQRQQMIERVNATIVDEMLAFRHRESVHY